eukprot:GEMP01003953.1.p1 GENE.GEMP01003953.1~~GEMP01003953.1.p1  ORF type:complete len:830 (+),score=119.35 GEMP01003953.1:60-2549(+)
MSVDISDDAAPENRERWSSRAAFVVAAIGSAIGMGNLWRFPHLCFKFGGGAFFIAYLLSLFFLGIPLLILEVGLGQSFQGGDAVVFGKMHPRLRAVGLASVWASFMFVGYFCVMIAWFVRMFLHSFSTPLPWQEDLYKYSSRGAFSWALQFVMEANTEKDAVPDSFSFINWACLIFVWLSVWACLFFGIKSTGRSTYFTMGLPVILIIVLLFRGITLKNAGYGLMQYLGKCDWSILTNESSVWSEACTQIFVSIGVTYGVMTAYASYNSTGENVHTNSWIVALSNSAFSIVGGFAVFSSLGHMCYFQSEKFLDGRTLTYATTLPNTTATFDTYPYGGFGLPFWMKDPADVSNDDDARKFFNQTAYQDWFVKIVSGCSLKSASDCDNASMCSKSSEGLCEPRSCPWQPANRSACESDGTCRWDSGACKRRVCGGSDGERIDDVPCGKMPYCELKNGECTELTITDWQVNDVPLVPVENMDVAGPALALGTYPVVFGTLWGSNFWSIMFFLVMFLLGNNSAFSFVEAVVTVLLDTRAFHRYKRSTVVTFVCCIGFSLSSVYCMDVGYNLMEVTDFYIGIVMLFIGICETVASCWVFRHEETIIACGKWPPLLLFSGFFFSSLLASVVGFFGRVGGVAIGLGLSSAAILIGSSLYLLHSSGDMQLTYRDRVEELFLGNVEYLRYRFNRGCLEDVAAARWYHKVPFAWAILVKFFIPPILVVLLFNMITATLKDKEGEDYHQFGNFSHFSAGYQGIGMVIAFTGVVVVFTGLAFPAIFNCLEHQSKNEEPEYMKEYCDERRTLMLENAFTRKKTAEIADKISADTVENVASSS